MATATYLSNPVVTVNAVDLSDQCTGATVNINVDQLEATAFGDTARKYVAGLGSSSITLDFYASFAATETWAELFLIAILSKGSIQKAKKIHRDIVVESNTRNWRHRQN